VVHFYALWGTSCNPIKNLAYSGGGAYFQPLTSLSIIVIIQRIQKYNFILFALASSACPYSVIMTRNAFKNMALHFEF
jgi:hypothetical protein